eukprot:TRINITY_DN2912_c0_g1_i5.p2 TRINITY_DN2912_c0_g1~~TRINITY_DN2912_c0_g1_i5.p2  ORF type:complete len:253 (-),score=32.33 TRINITY_DN2912_c0_g1_i5:548-1306(-)
MALRDSGANGGGGVGGLGGGDGGSFGGFGSGGNGGTGGGGGGGGSGGGGGGGPGGVFYVPGGANIVIGVPVRGGNGGPGSHLGGGGGGGAGIMLEAVPVAANPIMKPFVLDEIKREDVTYYKNPRGGKILLGRGGFGDVYKAKWQEHNVAVKKILPTGKITKEMIQKEIDISVRCRHPHLNSAVACYLHGDGYYILFPYMEHGDFSLFLEGKRPASIKQKLQILEGALLGLVAMMKEHIHDLHYSLLLDYQP